MCPFTNKIEHEYFLRSWTIALWMWAAMSSTDFLKTLPHSSLGAVYLNPPIEQWPLLEKKLRSRSAFSLAILSRTHQVSRPLCTPSSPQRAAERSPLNVWFTCINAEQQRGEAFKPKDPFELEIELWLFKILPFSTKLKTYHDVIPISCLTEFPNVVQMAKVGICYQL